MNDSYVLGERKEVECKGGRTRTNKIGVGAGVDIVVATSPTGLGYTYTDKIAIGACKAVNFVSDAEQSTWLPC